MWITEGSDGESSGESDQERDADTLLGRALPGRKGQKIVSSYGPGCVCQGRVDLSALAAS